MAKPHLEKQMAHPHLERKFGTTSLRVSVRHGLTLEQQFDTTANFLKNKSKVKNFLTFL